MYTIIVNKFNATFYSSKDLAEIRAREREREMHREMMTVISSSKIQTYLFLKAWSLHAYFSQALVKIRGIQQKLRVLQMLHLRLFLFFNWF